MKIVLFGAGASHGSGAALPVAPPLGSGLFDILARLFPGTWGQVPQDVHAEFRRDFEAGMALLLQRHGMAVAPLMQRMAIYFSRFGLPTGSNNLYARLFKEVAARDATRTVLASTLNYECLLEFAAGQAGLKVGYFEMPGAEAGTLATWKVHGSCNFQIRGINVGPGIGLSGIAIEGDGIVLLQPADVPRVFPATTALYPVMSLYAHGKPVEMAPAFLQEKQARWGDLIRGAEAVVVVGVHPNPEDRHIWVPLSETRGSLHYVGAREPFLAWQAAQRPAGVSEVLGDLWAPVFDQVVARLL